MAGERAVVSFKNVGLNDAADAFLGALFVGCRAGLVFILFDDCDIQHSQNRVDVRHYFSIYGGLWFDPRNVEEAYKFTRNAFLYSERFGIPVVIRITNILFDHGLHFSPDFERETLPRQQFECLRRYENKSPYVVHPSEALGMEERLFTKNQEIKEFVETLYSDAGTAFSLEIVYGAKRNIMVNHPLRLYTLPLPEKILKSAFAGVPMRSIAIYEHGQTPFVAQQINSILMEGCCVSCNMPPNAGFHSKYHNNTYMEKLFSALRKQGAIICGDLGGFTMDPSRTLHLCLCYGVSVAVSMGVGEVAKKHNKKVFCVTGDAAFLHSGQQCLYEMQERGINASIFVLENGGALGTGGQHIPGDLLSCPAEVRLQEWDYSGITDVTLEDMVGGLPEHGINLIIVHTHEQESKKFIKLVNKGFSEEKYDQNHSH